VAWQSASAPFGARREATGAGGFRRGGCRRPAASKPHRRPVRTPARVAPGEGGLFPLLLSFTCREP
jgi:hypothetical protein